MTVLSREIWNLKFSTLSELSSTCIWRSSVQYVKKKTCHCVEILRHWNATHCKITARAPPARRQASARPPLGSMSLKRCALMPFQQRLRLFPGGDAVHQQGIVHSHKLISKKCMTRLLHLHKLISKECNIWREVDTEKKKKRKVSQVGIEP